MEQPPVLVRSEQSLEEAIEGMKEKRVTVAFVIDSDGRIKGITTMEQAIGSARSGVNRVEEIAQQEFPSTSPDTPAEQILPLVAEGNVPVAVLDEKKHLLGVVTRSALIQAMQSDNGNNDEK